MIAQFILYPPETLSFSISQRPNAEFPLSKNA